MSELTEIDAMCLDREWVEHPDRYHERALKAAEAKKRKEEAEDKLKVVRAECAKDVREHPHKYNLSKPTVDAVDCEVELHPAYREAAKALIQAKYEYEVYAADVSAMDHRKRALEKLVDLLLADYFSAPKRPAGDDMVARYVHGGR